MIQGHNFNKYFMIIFRSMDLCLIDCQVKSLVHACTLHTLFQLISHWPHEFGFMIPYIADSEAKVQGFNLSFTVYG